MSYNNAEVQALTGVVQYYHNMRPIKSHALAPLTETSSIPKGRKI